MLQLSLVALVTCSADHQTLSTVVCVILSLAIEPLLLSAFLFSFHFFHMTILCLSSFLSLCLSRLVSTRRSYIIAYEFFRRSVGIINALASQIALYTQRKNSPFLSITSLTIQPRSGLGSVTSFAVFFVLLLVFSKSTSFRVESL